MIAASPRRLAMTCAEAARGRFTARASKGALAFSHYARFVTPMLVDGAVGLVLAPGGRLTRALRLAFAGGKIAMVEVIADPARLGRLELAVLDL